MADRSGGSDTYESADDATPKAVDAEEPKAEDPKVEAALALLALFAARLLIVGWEGYAEAEERAENAEWEQQQAA